MSSNAVIALLVVGGVAWFAMRSGGGASLGVTARVGAAGLNVGAAAGQAGNVSNRQLGLNITGAVLSGVGAVLSSYVDPSTAP